MAFRTWAFTIRPCQADDQILWGKALNKLTNCIKWWGAVEHKVDDDGVDIKDSEHIHVGMLLIKPMKKDVIDKWLVRTSKRTNAHRFYGDDCAHFVKVTKQGLEIWYSWDWIANYVQGNWMESREPNDDDKLTCEAAMPPKDDKTAVRPSREVKPLMADKIAEFWKRDYPDALPLMGTGRNDFLRTYIEYLMYTTKEIGLVPSLKMNDLRTHVYGILHAPKLPVMTDDFNGFKAPGADGMDPSDLYISNMWS